MSICVSDSTVDQESTIQIDDHSEQPQEANEKVSNLFQRIFVHESVT